MNKPWHVIKLLEDDSSRLVKESIIKDEAIAENFEFFKGVNYALNAMITFGLKQIKEKDDEDGIGLSWDSFELVLYRLVDRKLTGNLARTTIDELMATATKEQWNNWYRRILIKDLRCGVSEKTINKAVNKHMHFTIPVFSCQLAHDSKNHEGKVTGKKLIEVKLDGVRVLTVVYPTGHVDQFSRNGKELLNFEHVKEQFSMVAKTLSEPYVFDGEIMSNSFQDLMKQIHRKDSAKASDAVLYMFDMIPLKDFETGKYSLSQLQRSEQLATWFEDKLFLQLSNVQVVEQELVDLDTDNGQLRFKEINHLAIEGGYEGIMIKDIDAPYECKRSVAWLKLKPFIEVSLSIIAVEEGTGRNKDKLGALVCTGVEYGKTITVNVGSGFSDIQRDEYYKLADLLLLQIAEVRADAITQNQDGTYSLRFPRFLRFRGFVPGEKL